MATPEAPRIIIDRIRNFIRRNGFERDFQRFTFFRISGRIKGLIHQSFSDKIKHFLGNNDHRIGSSSVFYRPGEHHDALPVDPERIAGKIGSDRNRCGAVVGSGIARRTVLRERPGDR